MKKFEFICKTDLITGQTVWLTREDGIYVSNSLRLNKDQAYDIFIKLSNQEVLEIFEVLETKTSPNE
jgi:16S rRNA U1498 N3-methylase RsmE